MESRNGNDLPRHFALLYVNSGEAAGSFLGHFAPKLAEMTRPEVNGSVLS